MKAFLLYLSTLLVLSGYAQTPKPNDVNFHKGTLNGNIFSNDYFGFKIEIDSQWHILNKADINRLINERMDALNQSKEEAPTISKGAEILLSLTIDTLETMPHVLFSVLDLKYFPQLKNEKDYLMDYSNQVKKMYAGYDLQLTFTEVKPEMIGEKTFSTMLITIKADNFIAYQKRYSTKFNDKLFNIMTNYATEANSKDCRDLLNKMQWK